MELPNIRKKPPKLKTSDRTISVAIDNYSPSAIAAAQAVAAAAAAASAATISGANSIKSPVISDDITLYQSIPSSSSSSLHHHHLHHHHHNISTGTQQQSSLSSTTPAQIFYLDNSNSSKLNILNPLDYENYSHHIIQKSGGAPPLKRSDTLKPQMHYQIRKTHSFHASGEPPNTDEYLLPTTAVSSTQLSMARRSGSVRNPIYQTSISPVLSPRPPSSPQPSIHGLQDIQLIDRKIIPDTNSRRNCHMHRSFKDPLRQQQKHQQQRKSIMTTKSGTDVPIKYNSIGDDYCHTDNTGGGDLLVDVPLNSDDVNVNVVNMNSIVNSDLVEIVAPRKLSPNVSTESDVYRSRSNSANKNEIDSDLMEFVEHQHSLSKKQHKHNLSLGASSSLEKDHHNLRRGSRHTHSFYLNPNSFDELQHKLQHHQLQQQIQHQRSPQNIKKSFSASVRNTRTSGSASTSTHHRNDNLLNIAKKSKSFVSENYPDYDLATNNRRDSKIFIVDDLKRSPRLGVGNLLLTDAIRRSSGTNMNIGDMDYDAIMRAYKQNRRKSSIISASKKPSTKKTFSGDDIIGGGGVGGGGGGVIGEEDDVDPDDTDSSRKRKKIVCIIISVFLSLVFASVFVVVFTLTHSTVSQVQNQTKKVYTFSRDRDIPIHYNNNVRQENERLMQESLNRGRLAKNLTDITAQQQLATGEEIP